MSPPVIVTERWLLSTNVVERSCPFHLTVVDEEKCDPTTFILNPASPAFAVAGAMDEMDGCDDPLAGTDKSQTLRPCVAARRIREERCSASELTTTLGSPAPSTD